MPWLCLSSYPGIPCRRFLLISRNASAGRRCNVSCLKGCHQKNRPMETLAPVLIVKLWCDSRNHPEVLISAAEVNDLDA